MQHRSSPPCRALLLLTCSAVIAGCATADAPEEVAGDCRPFVGSYLDEGRPEAQPGAGDRPQSLARILELDPQTAGDTSAAQRAVVIRQVKADRYALVLAQVSSGDEISLWEDTARCVGDELRFEPPAEYTSADGVHVTRQRTRVALYLDADSTLILRREVRARSLGLLDLRKGGDPVDIYRFARRMP